MTDEMKLLMALCDALGFEVETVIEFDVDRYQRALNGHHMVMSAVQKHGIPGTYTVSEPLRTEFKEKNYKLTRKSPN